jgi:glycosyltransferase involved in cell wall biosynthesis
MSEAKRNLRIGYVAKMFPRLSETFVLNEILELERQGAEVVVFSAKKPNEGQFHPQLGRLQARVYYLDDMDPKKWAAGLAADWDTMAPHGGRIWDLVRAALSDAQPERIDLVWQASWIACRAQELGLDRLHAHFATLPALLAHLAHRVTGIPYSFTAHAKDIFVYSPAETRLGELIEHADFMVTVTNFNRRHLLEALPGVDAAKIRVLHNGIDTEVFTPVPASSRDTDHVLAVGRLVPKKGLDDLLTACALLRDRGRPIRCTIAGGGPDAALLEQRRRELGLEALVTMSGPIKVDAVRDLMRQASVFALPCRIAADNNVDALPTVLLEALASGLASVSTALSGVPEIISDGIEGRLVAPDQPASLADALEALLDDDEARARCGEAGRRKAVERFDIRRNVAMLHEMFRTGGQSSRVSGAESDDASTNAGAGRRVLYVCADRGIPLGGTKGASIHVREFIEALAAEGFITTVAVRRRERAAANLPCSAHVLQTDPPRPTLATPAGLEAHEFAQNPHFVGQLAELHREQPFDFVYERYSLYSTAGMAFARQAGLPFVLEVNAPLVVEANAWRDLQLPALAREIEAHVFSEADQVVAVSASVRDHILRVAPDARVTVLPNGVDTARIRPGAPDSVWRHRVSGGRPDARVVGFVGRVRPWHGVEILIAALAHARREDMDLHLCVVGDTGDLGAALTEQCLREGVTDAVTFLGAVAPEDVCAALCALDVVAAPYPELADFYFSPLKLFEYMAAGKPIVASATGQITDIIEDGRTGLLVPPGDVEALAAAVRRLFTDGELAARLGRAARLEADSNHRWRDRLRVVVDLWQGALRARAVEAS